MNQAPASSLQLYRRLLQYVRPYVGIFLFSILGMIIVAGTEAAFPALLKPLLDGSFVHRDPRWIRLVPILVILLFVVRGVATYISTFSISYVAGRLVMDLRDAMFRKLVTLPARFFADNSSGNIIAHVAFNVTQVTDAATSVITITVRDTLTIAGLLGWMLYLNWRLTIIALAVSPVITLIARLISRRLRQMSRKSQASLGDITHVLEEAIEGQKVVKIFGGQQAEIDRFHEVANQARRYLMKQVSASAASVPLIQLSSAIALAIIIYFATKDSATHMATVGSFVSFISAMLLLFSPLRRLAGVNEQMQRGLAASEVVFGLMDEPSEIDTGTRSMGRARGAVTLEHLDFRYPGAEQPALSDINLVIEPGETVALVGASGSGKTTLANLIPRFYPLTGGRILLDGIPVEEIKLADLRANIALVSQDVVLFNGTIADNIAYGPLHAATEAEIVAAAEAAHAMEFIRQLPDGLQTPVGENGVKLSGGQRQRLAIARALLKNAPVLILDEATSALDTASERHVQSALEALMQNRTTLVIAHRLSTIENADRIVVMHQGKIAEIGTHQALLAQKGIYARLHDLQLRPA